MVYKIKKSIPQYSLVDLLEILQYPNHSKYADVKAELSKREPSDEELKIARKGLEYRNKARNRPLSFIEILYCSLTPLIKGGSDFTRERDTEISFDDQLAEFEYHNESRKVRQFRRCRKVTEAIYGLVALIIVILALIAVIN